MAGRNHATVDDTFAEDPEIFQPVTQVTPSRTEGEITSYDRTGCHLLPCSIHFDGLAPTHVYFRPTSLPSSVTKNETKDPHVIAAQFRGRGLLALESQPLPADVAGTIMSFPEHGQATERGEKEVEWMGGTFESITEWRHEHDCSVMQRRGRSSDVLHGALGWIEVARSVHDPLP
eukprot:CAMPEP_0183293430 /NCGR_PEP_ID=MMETSP0160_2-20130417/2117_1 /TAXON_ID=2839 ORGANISM="Odontella Sinensis, Strain Grunow 1884" /NCGR_SAMPLE_ID=MMETSP0160_2 /ASSEMBLY_ACC=CAM_ASM_000250 /LENGTH=174 /DNA_ID=CAMNT_0025454545 /DNA_START=56 /DNA_END=580 /DNA_ORIENTATION=+